MTGAWDGHQLLLASARDVAAGCAGWVERGMTRREAMLYVADEAHSDVAALTEALAGCGVDAASAVDEGLLQVVEPHEFYLDGGAARMVDAARRRDPAGVRVFSGALAASEVLSPAEVDAFERALATLWDEHGVTSVCRYEPGPVTGPADLGTAFDRHGSGWGDKLLHAHRPEPDRLVLEGDADVTNEAVLSTMIRTAAREARTSLTVDCLDLKFVSVGAWRAAAQVGREVGERAAAVELSGLSRTQAQVLHALGLDRCFDARRDG